MVEMVYIYIYIHLYYYYILSMVDIGIIDISRILTSGILILSLQGMVVQV